MVHLPEVNRSANLQAKGWQEFTIWTESSATTSLLIFSSTRGESCSRMRSNFGRTTRMA